MPPSRSPVIELEGVRVHNLKNVSLKLPLKRLYVFSGVSGSGKSSLAFDTLYAEGQRRYIESFSAYARQFLDRLERPDADRVDHLPPAIAIRQNSVNVGARSTVATATEIQDYLRLLFAKVGRVVCPGCGREIRHDTAESVLHAVHGLPRGTRFQIAFPIIVAEGETSAETLLRLQEEGFSRVIVGDQTGRMADETLAAKVAAKPVWVVVDRLVAGQADDDRIVDSLETAFRFGDDRCAIFAENIGNQERPGGFAGEIIGVDGREWRLLRFNARLVCDDCRREFLSPQPPLFSENSPLGACPACRGFGSVPGISFEQIVPDPSKSLREGAIVPWTTPAHRHELDELLDLADDFGIPTDLPFSLLKPEHLDLIRAGIPERNFGGLEGFFRWLERHRYKMAVRIFLNRWRSYDTCSACHGERLQPLALCVRLPGERNPNESSWPNIADVGRMTIASAAEFFQGFVASMSPGDREVSRIITDEILARLNYLREAGVDYLTLDRRMRTLSTGEAQRVALTGALGTSLVNALYVLDEPSAGLHPRDNERLLKPIRRLRDLGNTVIVVEHEEAFIRAADEVVDLGPGAGRNGGEIIFQGTFDELLKCDRSITATFLSHPVDGNRSPSQPPLASSRQPAVDSAPASSRPPEQLRQPSGNLTLGGARLHNLQNVTVEFPLGVLCVIAGVSGSGKSTLIQETLYPALCRELRRPCPHSGPLLYDSLTGADLIDEVVLVDQSPVGRTPRSNPATYMQAFDDIRRLFAQLPDARLRNFTAKHFSFNAKGGGRCPRCNGAGSLDVDMQFLADVSITCPECHGTRFQREVLEIKYRGRNIADVLGMTVDEAFAFFRGQRKLQKQLKLLKDVGLEYLPLGQPANTLSGGESQRLKLASFLASGSKSRTLFLLDEPTTGLHAADVAKLLYCFESLLAVGHSLIVIEHNLDVLRSADWMIDLGPEAGAAGGRVVAAGRPAEIARSEVSITGRFLRE